MKHAIAIAKNGLGSTAPNPMVGCVIVCDDTIIGEGFTSPYGGPHAEVNAIHSVKNKELLSKSTLYVTLEPCSHFGKTPPCSNLIAKHNIPKIVIGCVDPNTKVHGKGIKQLMDNGSEVILGTEESLCEEHHKRFFTFQRKKRPYIILKWAETQDGFIAPKTKNSTTPFWISSPESQQLVHQWRAEEQAILVGGNTVVKDNPKLTTRHVLGKNPIRVVLDTQGNLPPSYAVFNDEAQTIHLTPSVMNLSEPLAQNICDYLYKHNICSIIVEGGAKTIQHFIDEGLWDEARIFKSNIRFIEGVKGPKLDYTLSDQYNIGSDLLYVVKNKS